MNVRRSIVTAVVAIFAAVPLLTGGALAQDKSKVAPSAPAQDKAKQKPPVSDAEMRYQACCHGALRKGATGSPVPASDDG